MNECVEFMFSMLMIALSQDFKPKMFTELKGKILNQSTWQIAHLFGHKEALNRKVVLQRPPPNLDFRF